MAFQTLSVRNALIDFKRKCCVAIVYFFTFLPKECNLKPTFAIWRLQLAGSLIGMHHQEPAVTQFACDKKAPTIRVAPLNAGRRSLKKCLFQRRHPAMPETIAANREILVKPVVTGIVDPQSADTIGSGIKMRLSRFIRPLWAQLNFYWLLSSFDISLMWDGYYHKNMDILPLPYCCVAI